MAPSSRKTLLLALFAVTACFLPIIQSLSIPPQPTIKEVHVSSTTEDPTTTQDPADSNDGFGDLVLDEENTDTVPREGDKDDTNPNDSVGGKRKPVLEVVDVIFRPFRPPSILVMDFYRKSNSTVDSSSNSDEQGNTDTSETSSEGGTTVSHTSASGSAETDSGEKHEGIISNISSTTDSDGRDNNDVPANRAQETNGIFPHKPDIGIAVQEENGPTSQMTSSSLAARKQFSMDNEDIDDARRVSDKQNNPDGNDDRDSHSVPRRSTDGVVSWRTSPSKKNDNSSSGSSGGGDGNNNQRRKRETHQMGNISKEDHDDDSTSSKNLTGKFQPDDMTKSSNNGDNVSSSNGVDRSSTRTATTSNDPPAVHDDNDTDDNGQHETTDGHKSGTVKVFLEILQLVPLSDSPTLTTGSRRKNDIKSNSAAAAPTITAPATTTTPENDKEDTDTKTVVQSMKANSNQEFSSANSPVANRTRSSEERGALEPEETHEVVATRKRVARSVTTKEVSEKKGNPSTSPTTSASPSSGTTSKPLTGKDAPAAPAPSANASAKIAASSTTTAPDDAEGPPLENVTQAVGRSDDD